MRRAAAALVALLLATGVAWAETPAPAAFEGIWTATKAHGQVFRGTWSAEVTAATTNVALGSWALLNADGVALMSGTWSARQARHGWRGTWSARVGDTSQVLSGTWAADDSTLKGRKTFRDLLEHTAAQQIAGIWHLGRTHGNWWLKAR